MTVNKDKLVSLNDILTVISQLDEEYQVLANKKTNIKAYMENDQRTLAIDSALWRTGYYGSKTLTRLKQRIEDQFINTIHENKK